MFLVIYLAYVWAQPLQQFQEPEAARIIFWHVPMAWLGMLWFFAGAVFALRYLFGKSRDEARMDRKVQVANEVGLICTVLATVTGSVFAQVQWGTPWNWDPKQVSITVVIFLYLAYFGLRMSIEQPGLRGRLSAVYAVLGAVAAPVLLVVIPQLPIFATLHPEGTIQGGLDSKWRTIYTMSFVGFLGITVWVFQLKVRLAALEERCAARLQAPEYPLDAEPRTEAVRRPVPGG